MRLSIKNKVKYSVAVLFFMLSFLSFGQDEAQNLVPNPSFESIGKKPKRLGSIESATGWVSPTGVRADLFVDSKVENVSTPLNIYGKEYAKEGGNYAGIIGYLPKGKSTFKSRSYVMTKLEAPMKKGMNYCVKFNISLAEASKYACNNIGAKLSKKPFGTDSKVPIIEDASLLHFSNDRKIFNARFDWTEICGTVTAKGGEKYITIGNFDSNQNIRSERMKKDPKIKTSQIMAAYYYVDDISVKLLSDEEICECQANDGGGVSYSPTIYQRTFNISEEMTATDRVEIQQVFFAFGKTKLATEGVASLELIAAEMQENPDMKLQINGHNNSMEDSVGVDNDYYSDMDNKRIGVVMEYLTKKGIPESRLIASRKGSTVSNDVNEEDDEDLRMAKNRRVTFKVR
jgi:outer membrane protein OmpA-like peptidoglycan-associated protein